MFTEKERKLLIASLRFYRKKKEKSLKSLLNKFKDDADTSSIEFGIEMIDNLMNRFKEDQDLKVSE